MKINILKKLRKKAIKKYSIVFYIEHGVEHYGVIDNISYFSVDDSEFKHVNDALFYLKRLRTRFIIEKLGSYNSRSNRKQQKKIESVNNQLKKYNDYNTYYKQ